MLEKLVQHMHARRANHTSKIFPLLCQMHLSRMPTTSTACVKALHNPKLSRCSLSGRSLWTLALLLIGNATL